MQFYFAFLVKAFLVFTTSIHVCGGLQDVNTTRHEKILFEDLFREYNKEIRPVLNQANVIEVKFEIALSEILDLDEKNQLLTTNVWVRQKWIDVWLKWNHSLYGGIKSINIDPILIWRPDILLYNNVHNNDNGEQYLFKTKAIIYHDGTVIWFSPNKLTTFCKIDIKYFPFDTQVCPLKFGSWTFMGDKLSLDFLNNSSRQVDLKKYSKNGEWNLLSANGKQELVYYPCCSAPYYVVAYNLAIKRRPLFYLNNLILPCIVLSLITAISFLFPPETGERVSLVVTVLLGMTVFMIVFTDFIPASSEVTPLIGKYFIAVLFEVGFCLLATCVPLRLQHVHSGTPMPHWLKVLVFDYLEVLMCFRFGRRTKISDHFFQDKENNNSKHNDIELGDEDVEKGNSTHVDSQDIRTTENTGQAENSSSSNNGFSFIKNYVDKIEREGELNMEWKKSHCNSRPSFLLYFYYDFYSLGYHDAGGSLIEMTIKDQVISLGYKN